MRDPDRIPEMLMLLGKIWDAMPDQRLGQLVANLSAPLGVWATDDDHIKEVMEKIVEEYNL